jgi:hypothetical protein
LTQIANEGFSKAKEEWEKNLLLWVRRSPSIFLSLFPLLLLKTVVVPFLFSYLDKCQAAEASTGTGSAGPTRHPTEEMDVDSNSNQPLGIGGAGSGDREGWMPSGQIFRDGAFLFKHISQASLIIEGDLVSAMKKKLEKEAMEQENND